MFKRIAEGKGKMANFIQIKFSLLVKKYLRLPNIEEE